MKWMGEYPQIGYINSIVCREYNKDKVTCSSATQSSLGVFVDALGKYYIEWDD